MYYIAYQRNADGTWTLCMKSFRDKEDMRARLLHYKKKYHAVRVFYFGLHDGEFELADWM